MHVRAYIVLAACGLVGYAQNQQEPGKSIGTVTTRGNVIVLTLNEGALGKANMFDLAGRTLRFKKEAGGYRAENLPLAWEAEFGAEMTNAQASLRGFKFPFSGKNWDAMSVGVTGSIRFGEERAGGEGGGRGGGVSIARFDALGEAGRTLLNRDAALCVFFKPRMSGKRFFKQLADRAVITWDITEPYGGIQDFTWVPTVNRFQAVLRADGSIDMSYQQVAARDAIVGVYPLLQGDEEKALASIAGTGAISKVNVSAVDGVMLKVAMEMREAKADTRIAVKLGSHVWSVRRSGRGGGNQQRVEFKGNTITVTGTLPAEFNASSEFPIAVDVDGVAAIASQSVKRDGIRSPEVHLSSVKATDGPFTAIYESFHYYNLPNARDLTCSVIKALGDKYDFLAYYSDFRIDNQEAGTPSNGPRGSSDGSNVTGINAPKRGSENFCSAGRFQWQFIQPVYVGSNQMQKGPPANAPDPPGISRNVAGYLKQIGEMSPDGKMPDYNYAMSQIAHEMGHRWGGFVSAKVGEERIQLGPTHWTRGLQAPVPFPFQRPTEASAMGGGVWQDNFDGTFTQLDDDYYVPATGWSYLDLYLMGLITAAEVPDFFILRNLVPAGRDANGNSKFKADRVKVTIQDVIAAEGPRTPTVDKSQRAFNTGMVAVVLHGTKPSAELIRRINDIAPRWIDYWSVTTGRRSTMSTNAK